MPPTSRAGQRWTTTVALSRYFGVDRRTIYEWRKHRGLRAEQVQQCHYADDRPRVTNRGQWRIYEDDLREFLERLRAGTPLPTGIWRK